jgi:hypothetical protein
MQARTCTLKVLWLLHVLLPTKKSKVCSICLAEDAVAVVVIVEATAAKDVVMDVAIAINPPSL